MVTTIPVKDQLNPELDLILERQVDVPVEKVWKAWTTPEHLMPWFCPKPWKTTECEIDLRPGGLFRTVMEGPEGERHDSRGCYLEVSENRCLVWTSALKEGYRPQDTGDDCLNNHFTAFLLLEPTDTGTSYTAIARHGNTEARKNHEDMGFHDGWGTVLDQLVDFIKAEL